MDSSLVLCRKRVCLRGLRGVTGIVGAGKRVVGEDVKVVMESELTAVEVQSAAAVVVFAAVVNSESTALVVAFTALVEAFAALVEAFAVASKTELAAAASGSSRFFGNVFRDWRLCFFLRRVLPVFTLA